MRLLFLFLIAFICIGPVSAQGLVCTDEDRALFEQKITELDQIDADGPGARMVAIGKTFLGLPYVAKTLEVGEEESLVVNLRGLDCTTFVENVLAFSSLLSEGRTDFDSYTRTLEKIRYKDGVRDGYGSRLHYFSEWIANNQAKGLVTNITEDLGGSPFRKEINFMSSHRELYPFLESETNYQKIKNMENRLNSNPLSFLPRESVAEAEKMIASGDIIALTTAISGLDITHTGLAILQPDGSIHLLHASSSGEVKISEEPLADYLMGVKNNTGIMVARPK